MSVSDGSALRDSATVVVVGGGISGLAAAWELSSRAAPETRIVVLEGSERVGGLLRSVPIGGRQVDVGADAFLARRPEAIELCAELGMSDELVPLTSSNAQVWSKGALRRLPDGLVLGVPTRIGPLARSGVVSPLGAMRAALDLVTPARRDRTSPPADRTVGEIVRGRLGAQVADIVTGPLVGGINAGRADDLSAEAVFPALIDAARRGGSLMRALRHASAPGSPEAGPDEGPQAGSAQRPEARAPAPTAHKPGDNPVFLTPRAGMASLPLVLGAALRSRGVEILTSQAVERIERSGPGPWSIHTSTQTFDADGLVLAVPARTASALLAGVDEELAGLLGGVRCASVVVVTFEIDSESLIRPLEGSGFLVPPVAQGLVTACTFLSTKWPHLAIEGEVLVRASAGRAGDDRAISMGDEELESEVLGELEQMLEHVGRFDALAGLGGLGALGQPRQAVVTRYPESFPQYPVGHLARVAAMEARAASLPAFAMAGSSYRGIGVPACVASGRGAARLVSGALVPK